MTPHRVYRDRAQLGALFVALHGAPVEGEVCLWFPFERHRFDGQEWIPDGVTYQPAVRMEPTWSARPKPGPAELEQRDESQRSNAESPRCCDCQPLGRTWTGAAPPQRYWTRCAPSATAQ